MIFQKTVVLLLNLKSSPSAAACCLICDFLVNFIRKVLSSQSVTYWASHWEKIPRSKITGVSRNTRKVKGTYRVTYRAREVTGTSEKLDPEKPFRRTSEVFKPLRGHNNNSRWRLASYTQPELIIS